MAHASLRVAARFQYHIRPTLELDERDTHVRVVVNNVMWSSYASDDDFGPAANPCEGAVAATARATTARAATANRSPKNPEVLACHSGERPRRLKW